VRHRATHIDNGLSPEADAFAEASLNFPPYNPDLHMNENEKRLDVCGSVSLIQATP
jgi:hypothetical protein